MNRGFTSNRKGTFLQWMVQGRTGLLFQHFRTKMIDIFFPALNRGYHIKIFSKGVDIVGEASNTVSLKGTTFVASIRHPRWYIRWICYRQHVPVSFCLLNNKGFASIELDGSIHFTSQDWNGRAKKGPLPQQVQVAHRLVSRKKKKESGI